VGALHDCSGVNGEQSCDAWLLDAWLAAAAPGAEKAPCSRATASPGPGGLSTPSTDALRSRLGVLLTSDSYFDVSGNQRAGAIFRPLDADPGTADPFHGARRYGFLNRCLDRLDVLDADLAVPGAERAARYEDASDGATPGVGAGPYYSAVYRRLTRPPAATSPPSSTASPSTDCAPGTASTIRPPATTR